jgi:hypothetical protein
MKQNANNSNIENERNIMSTNSMLNAGNSNAVSFIPARKPGCRLLKCKTLLWLALPLTLAVGCASSPGPAPVAYDSIPAPVIKTYAQRHAVDRVVGREIFYIFLTDTSTNQSMFAAVNDAGVVVLGDTTSDGVERQGVVDQVWELAGVTQVKDESGDNLAATPASKVIAAR